MINTLTSTQSSRSGLPLFGSTAGHHRGAADAATVVRDRVLTAPTATMRGLIDDATTMGAFPGLPVWSPPT